MGVFLQGRSQEMEKNEVKLEILQVCFFIYSVLGLTKDGKGSDEPTRPYPLYILRGYIIDKDTKRGGKGSFATSSIVIVGSVVQFQGAYCVNLCYSCC